MCGIVGLFPYNLKNDDLDARVKALVQRALFCESLVYMQPRGKDSTGIALLWDDHETAVIKQPVEAVQFAKDDGLWGEDFVNPDDKEANFRWLMQTWMRKFPEVRLRQALGHVRAGTKGSEYNPHNNHPIIVSSDKLERGGSLSGDITIGVHNGGIKNDDALFKKYDFSRVGEVDSEIIFHLMHQYRDDYTVENIAKTFEELTGAYAVMAFNPANTGKVACMRETRPLNAAYLPELGTLVLISERKYLNLALEQYERWRIREGDSMYSYTDDKGQVQDLGKVYDAFPYLTVDWYDSSTSDTMESGVFVLDIDTEVTDKTKAKDLVNVKKMFKPAKTWSTYGTSTTKYGSTTTKTTDRRSVINSGTSGNRTTTAPSAPKTEAIALPAATEKKDEQGIVDLSDYAQEVTDDELADAPVEGATVTVEVGEDTDTDDEYTGCPYSWEDRKAMASEMLYSSAEQLVDKLTLTCTSEAEIKELLDKYLIITSDTDEAATILASMYDVIFPEGFAAGFAEGYDTAINDSEALAEGEDALEDELHREVEALEAKVEEQGKRLEEMSAALAKVGEKHTKAGNYIASMRPLLRYFLLKDGILGANGELNETKLAAVRHNASKMGMVLALQPQVVKKVLS